VHLTRIVMHFLLDRRSEPRLESSPSHREPFVNPFRSRLPVSQSCQPSINPVALLPSTRSYALTAGRMHNQTAVSLMQIAVSIDRAKLRTFANLPPAVEYTARRVARSNVPQTAGYYSAARRASCLIAIYKPLPRGAEAILFRRLWPRDSSPSLSLSLSLSLP